MTSNINPNNIDGTYPVAGQDNNSQGFRDNFTNTKTNFQYAADEITDLQTKAVLKSALTGTTLDNDMGGSLLYNFQTQQVSETVVDHGAVSGSVTLDFSLGAVHAVTTSGSVTFSITNWPAAGRAAFMRVILTIASTSDIVTFPASVIFNTDSIVGWDLATNQLTSPINNGSYVFQLYSRGGGSVFYIFPESGAGQFHAGSEDLADGAAASLTQTVSYFSTTGAETATLAAGVTGQIKTFAMVADGGDMVITVTNPGWGGAGTITFDSVGNGCTLQYINSKWICIGNNGCTFA